MKNLYLLIALCIVPFLANAQYNIVVSGFISLEGEPVYKTVSGGVTYIDKVDVNMSITQAYPIDRAKNKNYQVNVYRATDNRSTGVDACDPGSTNKTLIGSRTFSSYRTDFQRTLTINVTDQPYSCSSCRIESYSIRIEVIALSNSSSSPHMVAGDVLACGFYDAASW